MLRKIIRDIYYKIFWFFGRIVCLIPRSKKNPNRVCIIRIDGIGDVVLFLPAFQYLKEKYNNYSICVICQTGIGALINKSVPIDNFIEININKIRKNFFYKFKILLKIYFANFETCINPIYSRNKLSDEIVLWSHAKVKIGWDTKAPNMKLNEKKEGDKVYTNLLKNDIDPYLHEKEKHKQFLKFLNIKSNTYKPYFNINSENFKNFIDEKYFKSKKTIGIVPGALSDYRKLEAEKYKQIIHKLNKTYNNVQFIIFGSLNDKKYLQFNKEEEIQNSIINLCGKTKVEDLPDLLKKCDLVIGNETGLMHIAITVGVPTITILGGGHFGRFMPYGDLKLNIFIYHKMDCFRCGWKCIYQKVRCIKDINADEVINEVQKLFYYQNK